MLASIFIIGVSLVLLVYWFRYSCILLLRDAAEAPTALPDDRFAVAEVRERLRGEAELDPLRQSLDRDYRVIRYLLRHAAGLEQQSIEDRLLLLDYKLMHAWYGLARLAAPEQARRALIEMASVLSMLARKIAQPATLENET